MPTLRTRPTGHLSRPSQPNAALAVLVLGLAMAIAAQAQSGPGTAPEAPPDRAKREAEKVYQLIRLHADKPRKPREGRDTVTPAVPQAAHAGSVLGSVAKSQSAAAVASPAVQLPKPAALRAMAPEGAAADAAVAAATALSSAAAAVMLVSAPALDPKKPGASESATSSAPVPALPPPSAVVAKSLELVSSVEPDFPSGLLRRLGKGSVVVNFDVLPDGSVGSTAIVKSSHQGLNAAAQAAVTAWRFKPISQTTGGVTELRFE